MENLQRSSPPSHSCCDLNALIMAVITAACCVEGRDDRCKGKVKRTLKPPPLHPQPFPIDSLLGLWIERARSFLKANGGLYRYYFQNHIKPISAAAAKLVHAGSPWMCERVCAHLCYVGSAICWFCGCTGPLIALPASPQPCGGLKLSWAR